VHLCPHSHNDPGWKSTFEQLYVTEVAAIYTQVVTALAANPDRTFNAEIVVFWVRWWQDQNDTMKQTVRSLVANGQLLFVGGGFVQPDEAITRFEDLVDLYTLGECDYFVCDERSKLLFGSGGLDCRPHVDGLHSRPRPSPRRLECRPFRAQHHSRIH
jgi:hypothetical protein